MEFDNYQKLKEKYSEKKLFDTYYIDLEMVETSFDDNWVYLLQRVDLDSENHDIEILSSVKNSLDERLKNLDVSQKYSKDHSSWSVFYTLKEIIDQIEECLPEEYKTYYRGQSGGWELQPTLFRVGENGYSDDFRNNYDHIYKKISKKFPEDVGYFPRTESSMDERATNLAELQHYGLGTPLIDISENPFISMLFMVDGYSGQGLEPQLDVFFVRDDGNNSLFQEVVKKKQNKRISVQKGAFLNFDRLTQENLSGVNKIPRICIRLKYLENEFDAQEISDLPDGGAGLYVDTESKKNRVLQTAVSDIKNKLTSYHYRTEDLFPDFYMYLSVLKSKYSDIGNTKKEKWYQVSD
ncbi:FRG domain-containing protein [Companilactobacillus nantensis]|uniref:FRG domain-containing protein n=1 Tax=Companilactobacillus nantensis DSM 16982 TaxID=1423774 RepID=A0A0R1WMK3_9LACO|nr:FRG domain-containing protein [Companilactobacillus nantensis]KRM15468.1 hypothetical protein FD31_GL001182 [Companilactobacillus nantensis DSM 16982]GEO64364.1 hypothetical protein LNA01_15470 [Companilactobacillus nantensis]